MTINGIPKKRRNALNLIMKTTIEIKILFNLPKNKKTLGLCNLQAKIGR